MAEEEKGEPISGEEIKKCNEEYNGVTCVLLEKHGYNPTTFAAMVTVANLFLSMRDETPKEMQNPLEQDRASLLKLMGETFDQLASQKV